MSKNDLTLYVDNQLVELGVQTPEISLNLVNFNPIYTKSSQSEYSFSFDIPSTPVNDKIFDYSNNLSKKNKFKRRYNCKVYCGEVLIFSGNLIINSYNAKTKVYNCNVVQVKVYNAEDIFGDDTLPKIKWEVDYQGAATINAINADATTKYKFPLVAYGKFQKVPYYRDDVAADYTSNFIIDGYNRFWHNSFPPSLNVLELIKRAFEQYGYNVGGSAFNDPYLSNIYASYNIADGQDPDYNVGNSKFGQLDISGTFTTADKTKSWSQDLSFPYRKVKEAINSITKGMTYIGLEQYNFKTTHIWNALTTSTPTISESPNYVYNPEECLIIAPASGFYEITLEVSNGQLLQPNTQFTTFNQWYASYYHEEPMQQVNMEATRDLLGETPVEIQLVRNYDDNLELIKGKNNVKYFDGNPNHSSITYRGWSYTGDTVSNKKTWTTCYPHQSLFASESPTETGSTTQSAVENNASLIEKQTKGGFTGGARTNERYYGMWGYVQKDNAVMPYDTIVSPIFLCGFSTFDGNTVSILKNGKSWDRANTIETEVFANVDGLDRLKINNNGQTEIEHTTRDENTYNNSPANYFNCSSTSFQGKVHMSTYLEKGDKVELMIVQRDFNEGNATTYVVQGNYHLNIKAISPKSYTKLRENPAFGYGYPTEFPYLLNLCNFTNKETKISDWINNVADALNLEISQDGYNITINSNKSFSKRKTLGLVDIDDRVNSFISEVESQRIDFPSKFSVEWNISEEEFGFVSSVPDEYINDEDWKDYADSGYTIIKVSEDIWNTDESKESVQFSYSWYYPYRYTLDSNDLIMNINVIGNDDLYIDDMHDANDSMSKDSYSDTQRFFYISPQSNLTLPLASYGNESVYITTTQNNYEDFWLSYKNTEKSLLSEYFNGSFVNSSANEVLIKDVLLSPEEYKQLKGGAMVKFDRDAYLCEKIENYSYLEKQANLLLYK